MSPEEKEAAKKRIYYPLHGLLVVKETELLAMQASLAAGKGDEIEALKMMLEAKAKMALYHKDVVRFAEQLSGIEIPRYEHEYQNMFKTSKLRKWVKEKTGLSLGAA